MGASCYNLIMAYGEDGWPNGCENDLTGNMNCNDCDSWCGSYTCPANDEAYYYRIENGLEIGNYKPDMTKEETQKWFELYKNKYKYIID